MHIGFLTPEYPNSNCNYGGIGTSIKNLAHALRKKGHLVSIFIYGHKNKDVIEEVGIRLIFIEQFYYKIGGWYYYRKKIESTLNKYIKEEKIDLIEAVDWTGITAFMNINCPLLVRLHGSDAYFCALENRKQKFKNRLFERKALQNADHIISVSNFTGHRTMKELKLNRDYEVIPNSVRIENFIPDKSETRSNRLLYFGTLIRKKGVLELAGIFNEVVRRNGEARLILAGRDVVDVFEGISSLELFKGKLTKEAAENFEYLGSLAYSDIRKEIDKASVVVLPSFAEALPMTWLEAMAMEKALVSSNIGWAPEVMVDGETGFMISPKEHVKFAELVLKLLDDSALREEMGSNARKRVEEIFSSEVVVEKNIEFYKSVLNHSEN